MLLLRTFMLMRTRRTYLTGITGTIIASIAGCLGSSSEEARDDYNDAIDLLHENDELLSNFAESDEIPDDFNAEEIKRRADSAEEKLDAAEEEASDEDQELIENARKYSEYQREAAEYNALLVEFNNCFKTVDAYIEADRFDAASNQAGECQDILSEVQQQLEATTNAHADVDPDLFGEDGDLEYADQDDQLQLQQNGLETLDQFIEGFQTFIAGSNLFIEGLEYYDEEQFGRAEDRIRESTKEFETSEETLGLLEVDPDTPEQFKPDIIEMHCYSESFLEASEYYADSAAAAEKGNWEQAEEYASEGETALEQCE